MGETAGILETPPSFDARQLFSQQAALKLLPDFKPETWPSPKSGARANCVPRQERKHVRSRDIRWRNEILMTRNFYRPRTEAHLRRTAGYCERYSGSINRAIAGLQIRHLLEVGVVGTRR